jgi:predicted ester cyclase
MNVEQLSDQYRAYIDCLNSRDLDKLDKFVCGNVIHNGKEIGLAGYRSMLESNFEDIPDLYFHIDILIESVDHVASRLNFNCQPKGCFLGLSIDGRRVSFSENVFYRYEQRLIKQVWSVIDKAAIEAQLASAD